ncbi:MAG TPA: phage major capsid protein, partial [Candidatus Limnocylindria bacterium]|nr:phage major capsid protein [Candidatus Limnocylindria bacterium]
NIARGQFVSDGCARFLASVAIVGAEKHGKLTHLKSDREAILKGCFETLGMEQRAALTTADIPLPTNFRAEVVELVWEYGSGRKYAMVVPLSGSSNKLPRLKTSPAFGFTTQSAPLDGKSPQFEWVTMNPEKAGGIVRIPSEIDADSIVALGQFIARYIAREMARWEDTVLFMADGTATYKLMSGVGKGIGSAVQS